MGNGRLNYINGYVSKDHDSVDVGLGEYCQKESTTSWLAAYRLLCKGSPCIPEVAIRLAQLSEFERSYSHVLLYPPQPAAMVSYEGRQTNFSSKMYGFYLQDRGGVPVHFAYHFFGTFSILLFAVGGGGRSVFKSFCIAFGEYLLLSNSQSIFQNHVSGTQIELSHWKRRSKLLRQCPYPNVSLRGIVRGSMTHHPKR